MRSPSVLPVSAEAVAYQKNQEKKHPSINRRAILEAKNTTCSIKQWDTISLIIWTGVAVILGQIQLFECVCVCVP